MDWLWWAITVFLMGLGFFGILIPFLPGNVLILAGAVFHFVVFGADRSVGWVTLLGLLGLTILAHVVDFVAGAMGAKQFGASKWGVAGAIIGGIVGLFFGLPGLLLGPVLGVLVVEIVVSRRLGQAARSTGGTILGGLLGLLAKLIIAAVMIAWFFLALPSNPGI